MDGVRLRSLFDWLHTRFLAANCRPSIEVVDAHDRSRKFRRTADLQRRLPSNGWAVSNGIALQSAPRQWSKDVLGWVMTAGVLSRKSAPSWPDSGLSELSWGAEWGIYPSDAGMPGDSAVEYLLQFSSLTIEHYGYLYFMPRRLGPEWYSIGMGFGHLENWSDEEASQIGSWGDMRHFQQPLLRDIYPYNFLTRPHLDLPVGSTTLEGWINNDSANGTLESLTPGAWTWRPPRQHALRIRENLFRAGVMHYWRFYVHPSDTFRHMPGPRPLRPDETTPEFFRADSSSVRLIGWG